MQNRARRERRGTQELLTIYVVERWLARLSRSPYVNDFILKGGMLLAAFGSRRPTVDMDALARNMAADQETVRQRVTEIASIDDYPRLRIHAGSSVCHRRVPRDKISGRSLTQSKTS